MKVICWSCASENIFAVSAGSDSMTSIRRSTSTLALEALFRKPVAICGNVDSEVSLRMISSTCLATFVLFAGIDTDPLLGATSSVIRLRSFPQVRKYRKAF